MGGAAFLVFVGGVGVVTWSVFCLTVGARMISSARLRWAEDAEARAKIQSAKQIQEANKKMDETNKAMRAQIAEVNKKADEASKKADALSAETRKNSAQLSQLSAQVAALTKGINLQTEQLRAHLSGQDQDQGRRD